MCRSSEGPPPAMIGLSVQRQDGGALGVTAWSGIRAAKYCVIPLRFNFSNLELHFNNNFLKHF